LPAAGPSATSTARLVAQRPRLAPHREAIAAAVAGLLGVSRGAVSVKATTSDRPGFTGRGEGIVCFAVVLLEG